MTRPAPTPDPTLARPALETAVAEANLGCLLPVIYQLTGEEKWLSAPYLPSVTKAFEELNDGGLEPHLQAEVRDAAVDAIWNWHQGKPVAHPAPTGADLTRLMSAAMGEAIDERFAGVVAEQLGFTPFEPVDLSAAITAARPDFSVLIVGAGVSGLITAISLRKAGVPFTILDRNREIGGTWAENRYPGARVDIPSDLYSFSFRPKNWSEYFSQRDEIFDYVRAVAAEHGVLDAIRFEHTVDGATWDQERGRWTVQATDPDGRRLDLEATVLITASGLHSMPNVPEFEGAETFGGEILHSATWPGDVDVEGKRVAVLGSGASAMQMVVALSKDVDSLTVLQRQPQWVAPNNYYFAKTAESKHWLYDHVPFYRAWFRFRLYWLYTERTFAALPVDPRRAEKGKQVSSLNDAYRALFNGYIAAQLDGDPELIAKTTPEFPPFGKRLLIDNGWYRALREPHVELLVDSIARLTPSGIVTTGGEEREIDLLALCTGFQQQRFLFPMEITGRDGLTLHDAWGEDNARAHLGMATPGFPNLFFLYGPNTNPPGGSWITIAEAQVRYITGLVTRLIDEELVSLEVKPEVFEEYNAALDAANDQMVYAMDGVSSYYRNSAGRVVTNFPWQVGDYWERTAAPTTDDYLAVRAGD